MSQSKTQIPVCLPLNPLVGHWITSGKMLDDLGKTFNGIDIYEWVAGGHFLLHRWDVDMPDGKNQGIEVVGYNASSKNFVVRSYDNQGSESSMTLAVTRDIITIADETMRFTGQFVDNGSTVQGTWQFKANEQSDWAPWMQVRLVRSGSKA
jgi:hypothetical protein